MIDLKSHWLATWAQLGVARPDEALYMQLFDRYRETHRHYHTLQHLSECLALLAETAEQPDHPAEVALALWFHDAIYDTARKDNEACSAQWARSALAEAGVAPQVADRVESLIMATCHSAVPTGRDALIVVDIDLAILGADAVRFAEYEAQVRHEYAWVPALIYRFKRRAVLDSFLKRPRLYATDWFHARFESRARANLA